MGIFPKLKAITKKQVPLDSTSELCLLTATLAYNTKKNNQQIQRRAQIFSSALSFYIHFNSIYSGTPSYTGDQHSFLWTSCKCNPQTVFDQTWKSTDSLITPKILIMITYPMEGIANAHAHLFTPGYLHGSVWFILELIWLLQHHESAKKDGDCCRRTPWSHSI